MATHYKLIEDVTKGPLRSAYVDAPFDKGLEVLKENNYDLISLQQNARLRIDEGIFAPVSRYSNYVREDLLYVPKLGKFLTKFTLILNHAQEATECHRNENDFDFFLTEDQVDESIVNSVRLDEDSIPTDRFGDNKITQYTFGKDAEGYGRLLREFVITEFPIILTDIKDKPFARKVWFGGFDVNDYNGLVGCVGLQDNLRLRGVKKNENI